jgi:hypothetical protein
MSDKVLEKTPIGRCAMPHILEKWGFKNNTPKFGVQILLEKGVAENEAWLKEMQVKVQAVIDDKWPDVKTRPRKIRLPIKNGNTWEGETDGIPKIDKQPYLENMWVVVLTGDDPLSVLDINGVKLTDKNKLYAGMDGAALFDMFAYDSGSYGVSFGIKAFKKAADNDKFPAGGGGTGAMDDAEAQAAFGCEPGDPDEMGVEEIDPEAMFK